MTRMIYVFVCCFLTLACSFGADEKPGTSSAETPPVQVALTNNTTAAVQPAEDLSKARLEVVNIRRSIEVRRQELIKENQECKNLKKELDDLQAALKAKADALELEYQKDKTYMELTSKWREKQKICYDVLSATTSGRKGRKVNETPSSSGSSENGGGSGK